MWLVGCVFGCWCTVLVHAQCSHMYVCINRSLLRLNGVIGAVGWKSSCVQHYIDLLFVCVRASACVHACVVLQCWDYITAAPWKSSLSIEGQPTDRSPSAYSLRLIWEVSVRLESRWWFKGAGHALAKSCSAKKKKKKKQILCCLSGRFWSDVKTRLCLAPQWIKMRLVRNIQIGQPSCSLEANAQGDRRSTGS